MRHKQWLSAAAAALAVGALFVQAPALAAGAKGAKGGDGILSRADKNGDGKVTFEELKAAHPKVTRERFDKMDRNHDGFLSEADRAGGGGGKHGVNVSGNDPDARGALFQSLMAADTNHDGKVSFEEVAAAKPGYPKADFDRVDRDKDGFITAQDAPRAPQVAQQPNATAGPGRAAAGPEMREALRAKLRSADTNHDGYVTREEARIGMPGLTDQRFNALDRNHDGKIGPGDGQGGARPNRLSAK